MIRRKNSNDKECSVESSLEVGMLSKSTFNDQELDNYLRQGEIKACEKPPVPPQILWVGDCTIATFGNFSASTGKAKSKKTFNIFQCSVKRKPLVFQSELFNFFMVSFHYIKWKQKIFIDEIYFS